MKKIIRVATSELKLDPQHIRVLTTTDLQQVVGGGVPTETEPCRPQTNKRVCR